METVFSIIKTVFLGFIGLLAVLFVLALLFGKRVVKKWDFEAEFRDQRGREYGEFEIELSHIAKEETEDTFKTSFTMRHKTLTVGTIVKVRLDDILVLQGPVETEGQIRLGEAHINTPLEDAHAGQTCRVYLNDIEQFSEAIVPD